MITFRRKGKNGELCVHNPLFDSGLELRKKRDGLSYVSYNGEGVFYLHVMMPSSGYVIVPAVFGFALFKMQVIVVAIVAAWSCFLWKQ